MKKELNKEKKEIEERFWREMAERFNVSQEGLFKDVTNFWLKELDSYANKKLEEERYEIADRFKHKFNGFGGKLGFTLSEILKILSNK